MKIIKLIAKIIQFIFSSIIILLGYSFFIEPNSLVVEDQTISLSCIKADLGKNRFVQISDLHFTRDTSEKRIDQVFNETKRLDPSAVFITGDLVSDENGMEKAADLVRKISIGYPVYIVFGNWDYWALDFNVNGFRKKLEDTGAKVLINDIEKISIGKAVIDVLGVKDPYTSGDVKNDLKKAMDQIGDSDENCKLLLAHSPNAIKEASENKIDLVLVGHTHGGQVYIPYLTEKFIPAKRKDGKGFVKGLYQIDGTKMYVNRGIGTSGLPLRFLLPPEITSINITK